jgi:hypothetical protein
LLNRKACLPFVANFMQFDGVNRLIGEMMSGLSTRYDLRPELDDLRPELDDLRPELDDLGRLIGDQPTSRGDAGVSLYDVM